MKTLNAAAAALTLAPMLLIAQTSQPAPVSSQSWSGLLVAAGCQTAPGSAAPQGSEMARATPTSTPMERSTPTAVVREQNRTYEQQQIQADRSAATDSRQAVRDQLKATDEVRTPPVDSAGTRGSVAPLTETEERTDAKSLDRSCRIGAQTTAFALRTGDGRLIPFDDASNARIAKQVQTGDRLRHKTKLFRVHVKGTLNGDAIALDSLEI